MVTKELEDSEDDIVDVAEPRSLRLLGVVESARPVDSDVRLIIDEFSRTVETGASVEGAEIVHSVEDGTVIANVVLCDHIAGEGIGVMGSYATKEVEVVGAVEVGEFFFGGSAGNIDVHEMVHAIP